MSFGTREDPPPPRFNWPAFWLTSAMTALVVDAATKLGEWAVEELKAKRRGPPKP